MQILVLLVLADECQLENIAVSAMNIGILQAPLVLHVRLWTQFVQAVAILTLARHVAVELL